VHFTKLMSCLKVSDCRHFVKCDDTCLRVLFCRGSVQVVAASVGLRYIVCVLRCAPCKNLDNTESVD
jgi:hypothetical protein